MIHAYAAFEPKGHLKPHTFAPSPLKGEEVVVEITHCGLCHSDLHLIDNDWMISKYPLIPGHEIIGHVAKKGGNVEGFEVGQRVGIGWQSSSCLHCEFCISGEETFCKAKERTCVDRYGGFASAIQVDHRFVYPIPEALESANAAPLLCGGITVYAPLKVYQVEAPQSVAVIGIGGLGHLALQYARAFGCKVTALSTSPEKEKEAKALGAHHFVPLSDLDKLTPSFDFILSTVYANLDWSRIAALLRPKGRLCFVGIPQNEIQIAVRTLISGNRSLCGSGTGSRHLMQEMLEFSARHGIKAQTELLPLSEVNQAIQKLRNNQARYRMVLTYN